MNEGNGLVTTIEIRDEEGRVIGTREAVSYAGLLRKAHEEGLKSIRTTLVQAPSEANQMTAISMAEVVTEKGIFTEIGDANASNVDPMIVPHIIRMSVTRAKARALRDAINIGVVSLEELCQEITNGSAMHKSMAKPAESPRSAPQGNDGHSARYKPATARSEQPNWRTGSVSGTRGDLMTENQRRYLYRILAEHGVTGDDARNFLTRTLRVRSIKEAGKSAASELIESLLADAESLLQGHAVS